MGWAERANPNSEWNKKRVGRAVGTDTLQVASPITNESTVTKVQTPVKRDEPKVIEITRKSIWGSLCRMLNPLRRTNHAPTS